MTVIDYLRELEGHLLAMKIQVQSGIMPRGTVDCAQAIIADALRAAGETPLEIGMPLADPDSMALAGDIARELYNNEPKH